MTLQTSMRRLWCRVFHFQHWTTAADPSIAGRYVWLRCGRCKQSYSFRVRIPAKAPVGKTSR